MLNFLNSLKNVIAIIFTWLMILLLGSSLIIKSDIINTHIVAILLLFSSIIGTLFMVLFRTKFSKNNSFIKKMSLFFIGFVAVELLFFFTSGIDKKIGSINWVIFTIIVIGLYAINMLIYHFYSCNREKDYTKKLHEYQKTNN